MDPSYQQGLPLQCTCCNKTFSGAVPAQQHFDSVAHKKKAATATQAGSRALVCDVCNIACDTYIMLEQHKLSPRHVANVEKKQMLTQERQLPPVYQASGEPEYGTSTPVHGQFPAEAPQKEYDFDGNRGFCYICNIELTSSQHATQHLNGSKHKKKQAVQSALNQRPAQSISPRILSQQNIVSQIPNVDAEVFEQTNVKQVVSSSAVRSVPNYSLEDEKLYCDICDHRSESHESMIDHLKSSKHVTNLMNENIKLSRSSSTTSIDQEHMTGNHSHEYVSYSAIHQKLSNLMLSEGHQGKTNTEHGLEPEPEYGDLRECHETHNKLQKFFNIDTANVKMDSLLTEEESVSYRTAEETSMDEIIAKPFPAADSQRDTTSQVGQQHGASSNIINRSISSCTTKSEPGPTEFIRNNLRSPTENTGPLSLPVLVNNQNQPVGIGRGVFRLNNDSPAQLLTKQNNLIQQNAGQINSNAASFENTNIKHEYNEFVNADASNLATLMSNLQFSDGIQSKPFTTEMEADTRSQSTDSINAKPFPLERPSFDVQESSKVPGMFAQLKHKLEMEHRLTSDPTEVGQDPFQSVYGKKTEIQTTRRPNRQAEYTFNQDLNRGHCNICDIALTSLQHMEQHLGGRKHKNAKALMETVSVQSSQIRELFCDVCLVPFSGPEAQEMHLKSDKHKKKLEQKTAGTKPAGFVCKICSVECSGEENYRQHLIGEKHKKKLAKGENDNPNIFFCDICKIECSGEDNYKQHLAGEKHRKKAKGYLPNQLNEQCEICNCIVNSRKELIDHQRAIHPEKFQTVSFVGRETYGNLQTTLQSSCQNTNAALADTGNPFGNGQGSFSNPLEAFLSLELFPEPKEGEDKNVNKIEPTKHSTTVFGQSSSNIEQPFVIPENSSTNRIVQIKPKESTGQFSQGVGQSSVGVTNTFIMPEITTVRSVQVKPRYATMPEPAESDSTLGQGQGGAKRSQGSDLAFATKNRSNGNQNSPAKSRQGNAGNQDTDDIRTPETNDRLQGENPFAATHPYYCKTCNAPSNTRESYENHLRGKRHMSKVGVEPAPERLHCEAQQLGPKFKPHTQSVPRDYQWELYDMALSTDTVCFLPTGTGKTMVSVMLMSTMLELYPTRPVLFIVDKVLLVLQQSQYITTELGNFEFTRYNPDSRNMTEVGRRRLSIATLCMDQQSTHGVPLWKHDVIVVTAAFCQHLLDRKIIRWEDFSLVVFDEAHHCDKKHPFNMLLYSHHLKIYEGKYRPKILGLTASPAGKDTVPATLNMLEKLVGNMGGVAMNIVQKYKSTLAKFQSNAEIIVRPQPDQFNEIVDMFVLELQVYLVHCYLRLAELSNIQCFCDLKDVNQSSDDVKIRLFAASCIEEKLEDLQLALLNTGASDAENKNLVRLLVKHAESMCMTLNSLLEGGIPCALEEMTGLENEKYNFQFAKESRLPCNKLQALYNHTKGLVENPEEVQFGSHISRLVDELTNSLDIDWSQREKVKPMALVLVKERATVHKLTRELQKNQVMQRMNLRVTSVVGHGKTGASEAAGMRVNQQKRVLEEIKQYKYQVIIATSVAEEGVDWPECELVVSLYPPSSLTALVQMRGRARKKNSKFVVLCSCEEQRQVIEDLKTKEQNMIEASEILFRRSLDSN